MKSLSLIRSKIYISEKKSSAKRLRLASDTQEMPGSQKQIVVNSTVLATSTWVSVKLHLDVSSNVHSV